MFFKILCNFFADCNSSKLYIATGNTFCKGNNIRLYIKIFKCKHLARSAKASHNLIANHQYSKLITKRSYPRQISFRWNNNTIRACYCLHFYRCDTICPFIDNLLSKLCQIVFCCLLFRSKCNRFSVNIRIKKLYKSRNARLKRISSGFSCQISCSER